MDFEKLSKRYDEFWSMENTDRPLLITWAKKDGADYTSPPIAPKDKKMAWLDLEYLIKSYRYNHERTEYLAESYPSVFVNFGPDILGAICGCEIEFGDTTSWAVHNVEDWNNYGDIIFDPSNKWFKRLDEYTKAFVEDSKGEYIVGVTDLHPGLDTLVSLRGPEELCIDLFDCPDFVKKYNFQVLEVFKKVFESQLSATSKYLPYTTNWMQPFSRDRQFVTSCDFSCLISEENFEEFVIPELLEEIEYLDSSIYHLDGTGALRHLDRLLEIKKLKGIQWVPGAGKPKMKEWIPVLKKIQDAGKVMDITVEADEIIPICENLKPNGVLIHCYDFKSKEHIEKTLKYMREIYK